jgi:hypothetical protein
MAAVSRQSGGVIMSRVIAVMACGFTVAACSASVPSLNFLNSSPPTAAVRFESEPAGAEVKTPSGQSCRTPCELQVAPELSVTFALAGCEQLLRSKLRPQELEDEPWGSSLRLRRKQHLALGDDITRISRRLWDDANLA